MHIYYTSYTINTYVFSSHSNIIYYLSEINQSIYYRDLSYNQISVVPAEAVSNLPYLRILQLDNNNIKCINKKAFTGRKNLLVLPAEHFFTV